MNNKNMANALIVPDDAGFNYCCMWIFGIIFFKSATELAVKHFTTIFR